MEWHGMAAQYFALNPSNILANGGLRWPPYGLRCSVAGVDICIWRLFPMDTKIV